MLSPGFPGSEHFTQSVTCTDGTPFAGPRSTAMAQAPAFQRGGKVVVRGCGSLFGGGHGGCVSQVRGNREDAFGCGRRGRGASAERPHIPVEKLGGKARRRWSQHDSRMDEGGCGFGPKVVKYANRSWTSDLRVAGHIARVVAIQVGRAACHSRYLRSRPLPSVASVPPQVLSKRSR